MAGEAKLLQKVRLSAGLSFNRMGAVASKVKAKATKQHFFLRFIFWGRVIGASRFEKEEIG